MVEVTVASCALLMMRSIDDVQPYVDAAPMGPNGLHDRSKLMDVWPAEWSQAGKRRRRDALAHIGSNNTLKVLEYRANQQGATVHLDTDLCV
jgi:hypothetical protein